MAETWKLIFEGRYAVSSYGRVVQHKEGQPVGTGKEMRQSLVTQGNSRQAWRYRVQLRFGVNMHGTYFVHRLVADAFLEHDPLRRVVNHKDGNPGNNHVENLEWVTHKENAQHASIMGLLDRGSSRFNAKVNEDTVLAIRMRYAQGERVGALAKEFKMALHPMQALIRGETWAHVSGAVERGITHKRKLTDQDVAEIREKLRSGSGVTQSALCREYQVSPALMCMILSGKRRPEQP